MNIFFSTFESVAMLLFIGVIGFWMEKHDFKSIADFQGKLCREGINNPELYERLQYIIALSK